MANKLSHVLVAIALVHAATAQRGWGYQGHSTCARIAQHFMSDAAKEAALELLPDVDGDITQIASWADDVRPQREWSAPLHYIDVPDWECSFDYDRDCHNEDGERDMCVAGAVKNYSRRLTNMDLPVSQRVEALKNVVHFIGDVHQPLHVSFSGDRGGNDIKGKYFNASTNLHAIWDYGTIEQRLRRDFGGSEVAWTDAMVARIASEWKNEVDSWRVCPAAEASALHGACSTAWAKESISLCCGKGYVDVDGKTHITTPFVLGEEYYAHTLPVIEHRLAQCGVRLAHVLNNIFPEEEEGLSGGDKLAIGLGVALGAVLILGGTAWWCNRRSKRSTLDGYVRA